MIDIRAGDTTEIIPFEVPDCTEAPYFTISEELAKTIPCTIEQVNTSEGIQNAGGKLVKYIEVLRLFCVESRVITESLAVYYAKSRDMFRIKIHGLKNSCSCIGAADTYETVRKVEVDFKQGMDVTDSIPPMCASVDALIDSILKYLDTLRILVLAHSADNRELCMIPGIPRELAAELREAMQNLELEDVHCKLADVRSRKYSDEIEIYLDRMTDLVNQYDFDEAIKVLEKITERI